MDESIHQLGLFVLVIGVDILLPVTDRSKLTNPSANPHADE